MGVSISVLAHRVMKRTIQFIARLTLILRVSYDAIRHMAAVAVNELIVVLMVFSGATRPCPKYTKHLSYSTKNPNKLMQVLYFPPISLSLIFYESSFKI